MISIAARFPGDRDLGEDSGVEVEEGGVLS